MSSETRAAFGRALDKAMGGMKPAELLAHLNDRDITYTDKSVSSWRNGKGVPGRSVVLALDEILQTGGALAEAVGYGSSPGVAELAGRIDSLERDVGMLARIAEQSIGLINVASAELDEPLRMDPELFREITNIRSKFGPLKGDDPDSSETSA